jgi:transcriptional regulator GlxA family with amidase domain
MLLLIFVTPNVHALEVAGIRDALFEANHCLASDQHYDVRIVAAERGVVRCASGLDIVVDHGVADAPNPGDTAIVAGAVGVPVSPTEPVITWLQREAATARRCGAACIGALLLCEAGLIDDRHVTTHWQYADVLASRCPTARVEADRIFIRDGSLFTSAGSAAAIDLSLSLIEEDHGRPIALQVARCLVAFLKRPGGQSRFSVHLALQTTSRMPNERVQQAVRDHPRGDFGLTGMARLAAMSPRNFSRVFRREAGMSPADFVELTRIGHLGAACHVRQPATRSGPRAIASFRLDACSPDHA